ncbi:centrobin, centrosomal BRCA2 interacting protein (predicted), isoform CRA_a [Rattus norvegicus]|uniref:Centrobin, centrosomal BRCA2 interacting protein (Predicted), isoform CRA_a n=1 Tax=Rattus norvegicus TaxID=10116 RepID=A6HFP6_RAT|nr:centrobin, centrosomal BRCA2 interacting protein (predicted), isoform CRA_a [Rattus norvegicus]
MAKGSLSPEETQTPVWVRSPGKRSPPKLSLDALLQPLRLKSLLGRKVGILAPA